MLIKKVEKISQLIQTEGSDLNFMDLAATLRDLIPGSSVIWSAARVSCWATLVGDFESTAFDAEWIDEGILPDDWPHRC